MNLLLHCGLCVFKSIFESFCKISLAFWLRCVSRLFPSEIQGYFSPLQSLYLLLLSFLQPWQASLVRSFHSIAFVLTVIHNRALIPRGVRKISVWLGSQSCAKERERACVCVCLCTCVWWENKSPVTSRSIFSKLVAIYRGPQVGISPLDRRHVYRIFVLLTPVLEYSNTTKRKRFSSDVSWCENSCFCLFSGIILTKLQVCFVHRTCLFPFSMLLPII